jgi:GNAT superfamily N-acetyltransferase
MTLRIDTLQGEAVLPLLADLAWLRIAVFREYPYLYQGDTAYEETYLRTCVESPRAAVVVASNDGHVIGASTCLPLTDETDNVIAPFRARGWDPARFFYFGESVLLPAWRGRGLGVAFFNAREAHARIVSDCDFATFCGVRRPVDHSSRPASWVPLDAFWRKRGYTPIVGLSCQMSWRELGAEAETSHDLDFWMRSLTGVPLPGVPSP